MGIEREMVGIYIALIAITIIVYTVCGLVLLRGHKKTTRTLFLGSGISTLGAFFFLFNCYFRFDPVEKVSNMTSGIGLFLIAWVINLYCVVKVIHELQRKKQ